MAGVARPCVATERMFAEWLGWGGHAWRNFNLASPQGTQMATEIVVPTLGESVTEATVGKWFKKAGDTVKSDEALAELETDKVTLEVNAPASGVISEIVVREGESVAPGAILGSIMEGASVPASPKLAQPAASPQAAPAAPAAPVHVN